MKTSAIVALSFVCGAVVGASAMALYFKRMNKNEIAEPEQDTKPSEPEAPSMSEEPFVEEDETESIHPVSITTAEVVAPETINKFSDIVKQYGGTSIKKDVIGPYVISEEDLDEYDDYDSVFLTYYADGVLADDNGVKIDNIDDVVGEKFSQYFGAFGQPDLVCIRNDDRRCDYSITKSLVKWSTVDSENPHMKWR